MSRKLENAKSAADFAAIAKAAKKGYVVGMIENKIRAGIKLGVFDVKPMGAMPYADLAGYKVIVSPYNAKRRNILRRAFIAAFIETVNA